MTPPSLLASPKQLQKVSLYKKATSSYLLYYFTQLAKRGSLTLTISYLAKESSDEKYLEDL